MRSSLRRNSRLLKGRRNTLSSASSLTLASKSPSRVSSPLLSPSSLTHTDRRSHPTSPHPQIHSRPRPDPHFCPHSCPCLHFHLRSHPSSPKFSPGDEVLSLKRQKVAADRQIKVLRREIEEVLLSPPTHPTQSPLTLSSPTSLRSPLNSLSLLHHYLSSHCSIPYYRFPYPCR